jgi:hypothetical protein
VNIATASHPARNMASGGLRRRCISARRAWQQRTENNSARDPKSVATSALQVHSVVL